MGSLLAAGALGGEARASTPFDGAWLVNLACPASQDGRALAFSYAFAATVSDGVLHGERGTPGEGGWLSLEGRIASDGSADMTAKGLTNIPTYALDNVRPKTPFVRKVSAEFEPTKGSGRWTTGRVCVFEFARR